MDITHSDRCRHDERREIVAAQYAWAERIVRDLAEEELKAAIDRMCAAIKGPKRTATLVALRARAARRLRNELKWSTAEIGKFLGNRDHATVIPYLNGKAKALQR